MTMDTEPKLGLVLEGGGMRGVYTAGVMDYFLEENFFVDNVIGVSAGAVQAVNLVSKQPKRGFRVIAEFANDKRYMSIRSLFKTGDFFNKNFCYDTIPNELDPFDYETFKNSLTKCYAGCTNLETGAAEYMQLSDLKKDMDILRASGSLPLMSNSVIIKGKPYLDGGVGDSIPLKASQEMGYAKNIVVLTRAKGYRKKPNKLLPLIRLKYRKYPLFVIACEMRFEHYNNTLDYIEESEKKGETFVIRPEADVEVARLERDVKKLTALYEDGYAQTKSLFGDIKKFIGKV
ncbi:MAG: patatin family protein [Fibrobacteraceae bacterium]